MKIKLINLIYSFLTRKKPISAMIGITHRCNYSCAKCFVDKSQIQDEMSLKDIVDLSRVLQKLGIIIVGIAGGEPFLRDDLPSIIRAFSSRGIRPRLLTNGSLANYDNAIELKEAGLGDISISLDSSNPSFHDRLCNKPGAWKKAVFAIELFKKILPSSSKVLINALVNLENLEDIPKLINFAKDKGALISLLPIENYEELDIKYLYPGKKNREKVYNTYETILKMKKNNAPIFNSSTYLKASAHYLAGEKKIKLPCDAGKLYLSVGPRGFVDMCHIGSDDENSAHFRKFSWPIPNFEGQRKKCKGCLRPCWREISLLFRRFSPIMEALKLSCQ